MTWCWQADDICVANVNKNKGDDHNPKMNKQVKNPSSADMLSPDSCDAEKNAMGAFHESDSSLRRRDDYC